jgi:UDPglucose--hexose-1-phosphate uridylyltransferase
LTIAEVTDLADILKRTVTRYDNLFNTLFPYSLGIHQAPVHATMTDHWHWHIHIVPLCCARRRCANSWSALNCCAEPQRDITPEQAAKRLRELSEMHYREGK